MSSKRIQGDMQGPVPQEPEPDEKVDPEKFKKVMKVDESDEAQKRNKRNLKREEEEGEDEDAVEAAPPPPPSSAFSDLMSDKEDPGSVLDSESGGIRRQTAPQENVPHSPPKPGSISTEGVELEEEGPTPSQTPIATPPPQTEQAPPTQQPPQAQTPPQEEPSPANAPSYGGGIEETPPPPPNQPGTLGAQGSSSNQNLSENETQNSPVKQSTNGEQTDQPPTKKKSEADASLLASQPKTSDLKPKKKVKSQKRPEDKIVSPPSSSNQPHTKIDNTKTNSSEEIDPLTTTSKQNQIPTDTTSPNGAQIDTHLKEKPPSDSEIPSAPLSPTSSPTNSIGAFTRLSPEEVRKQRMAKAQAEQETPIEGVPITPPQEGSAMGHKKEKDDNDEHFIEATPQTASIPLPVSEAPIPPVTPSDTTPAYSRLAPETYELFERMGGVMTILNHSGVTTTTMTVSMPDSVFNGTQIIIDHYSTAPNAFNIQLVGTPEAVTAFTQNMPQLEEAFKQANYNFEANILNPILTTSKKKSHKIRRKGAAGDKGDKQQS